jgi:hypothetical protein
MSIDATTPMADEITAMRTVEMYFRYRDPTVRLRTAGQAGVAAE